MKLILARHGQTHWNSQRRLQGRKDSALTTIGKSQARLLGRLVAREPVDVLLSSDLGRSYATASFAARRLHLKARKMEALREISYGKLEGMNEEEMARAFPGVWARRQKDRLHYRVPGGENYLDVAARLKPFLQWLLKKHKDETVLLVGHGNLNRILMGILLKLAPRKWLNIHQPNYVVYFLDIEKGRVKSLKHISLGHHRKQPGLFKVKWWQ